MCCMRHLYAGENNELHFYQLRDEDLSENVSHDDSAMLPCPHTKGLFGFAVWMLTIYFKNRS